MLKRPRRNRKTSQIRDMVAETSLDVKDLILPLFLKEGDKVKEEIDHMPGVFRYSTDQLLTEVEQCLELSVKYAKERVESPKDRIS